MTDKKTGGPAFPGLHPSKECHYQDAGMALRDYFAAKAMPAVYQWFESQQLADRQASLALDVCELDGSPSSDAMLVATWSYGLADAMIRVRNGD